MVHGGMVYTELAEMAAVSCGTSCKYTTSVDIQKRAIKSYSYSYRLTCERCESARERRIALYKSDQQQQQQQQRFREHVREREEKIQTQTKNTVNNNKHKQTNF